MIAAQSDPKWEKLLKGEYQVNFRVFAGNMLLNRLSRSLAKDSSSANLKTCITEAHAFFTQFETLYRDELKKIFG